MVHMSHFWCKCDCGDAALILHTLHADDQIIPRGWVETFNHASWSFAMHDLILTPTASLELQSNWNLSKAYSALRICSFFKIVFVENSFLYTGKLWQLCQSGVRSECVYIIKKGWNLANSLAPCNMVFIAQMSCFLEDVNSFDSGHKFRTHICTVRSKFFYVGSWKLWDVSCYNVNHIWTQNFLNGKSILAGQKGQSILNFPCSTLFCAELCTQSFQSILERVLARMDEFDKCAVPPGHFCLNISLCVWAVVHKNWAVCG